LLTEFSQLPSGPVGEFTKDIKQKKLTVNKILKKTLSEGLPALAVAAGFTALADYSSCRL
jgi:hypothetical protein